MESAKSVELISVIIQVVSVCFTSTTVLQKITCSKPAETSRQWKSHRYLKVLENPQGVNSMGSVQIAIVWTKQKAIQYLQKLGVGGQTSF